MNTTTADKALFKLLKEWNFKTGETIKLGSIIHLMDGLNIEFEGKDVSESLTKMFKNGYLEMVGESNVKLTDEGHRIVHHSIGS